jgi:hypothetical protein
VEVGCVSVGVPTSAGRRPLRRRGRRELRCVRPAPRTEGSAAAARTEGSAAAARTEGGVAAGGAQGRSSRTEGGVAAGGAQGGSSRTEVGVAAAGALEMLVAREGKSCAGITGDRVRFECSLGFLFLSWGKEDTQAPMCPSSRRKCAFRREREVSLRFC